MLNHCFSLLNYFKSGISFFKEIRVVNSHIRYCLIFKLLVGFCKLRLPFRQRSVSFRNWRIYYKVWCISYWKVVLRGRPSLSVTAGLLYHVVFCLSSTFFKVFWDFFRKRNASVKTLSKLSKVTPLTLANDTIFKILCLSFDLRLTRQLDYNTTPNYKCQHLFCDLESCIFLPTNYAKL